MDQNQKNDTCGCCLGVDNVTPVRISNLPSQGMVAYRIGTHSRFKKSMLAALAKAEYPALLPLGTRDDDDFTIACLDGVATLLDVLTFYQERYVNEHYLKTATERRSILEMAQLIGYELSPGVAAATHLAFTLQTSPGNPATAMQPITIGQQTRVQSVPGQDETPQIFETNSAIQARAAWNAVAAQRSVAYTPAFGDLDIFVEGVSHNIRVGDAILLVGQDRMIHSGSERWDVRVVKQVETDMENLRTHLVWDTPLGNIRPRSLPADSNVSLYVFRRRTGLFGHNAPDPRLMSKTRTNQLGTLVYGSGANLKWKSYTIERNQIDLAGPEDKVVAGSWIALVSNADNFGSDDLPGYVELYRAEKVYATSRLDYGVSGKITRIKPDVSVNTRQFTLRKTLALVASEELPIHKRPLVYPVYGDTLGLNGHVDGLVPDQYLSVSGKLQRLKVAPGARISVPGGRVLNEGDSVQIISTPEKYTGSTLVQLSPQDFGSLISKKNSSVRIKLRVTDRDGSTLSVSSYASAWLWDSDKDDPVVAEIARIKSGEQAIRNGRDRTVLTLASALRHVFQRDSVAVNFNVAPASHGETVTEILGDGDARKTDQSFVLRHPPLTYVSADSASGAEAALEVRVNELRWNETASLYRADSDARVYQLRANDDSTTSILFGDGVEGGRLPTGRTNVRATYRHHIGVSANLGSNQLTTLLQKPLGVTEVTNPEPSTGGADPEVIDDARQNAPITVLTLDRAVSVQDYRDYARAFSGIAKAHALWINSGPSRGIYITLAGINGANIPVNSSTYINLLKSLRRYGDPMLPLRLVNFTPVTFTLGMAVKVNIDAERETVLRNLETVLRESFSFKQRDFGQHVSQDEVLAVAHSVEQVEAIRITRLFKNVEAAVDRVEPIIPSHLPFVSLSIAPRPAELVTLSDEPLEMEAFT